MQVGNDFQGWEIQEVPNGPINQPPAMYIKNIKSKRCLEFRGAGTGQTLYASEMKNRGGHRPDDSQHWHFRPVGLGVVGCVPFHSLFGRIVWLLTDEDIRLTNVKYGTAMKLVQASPPNQGSGCVYT